MELTEHEEHAAALAQQALLRLAEAVHELTQAGELSDALIAVLLHAAARGIERALQRLQQEPRVYVEPVRGLGQQQRQMLLWLWAEASKWEQDWVPWPRINSATSKARSTSRSRSLRHLEARGLVIRDKSPAQAVQLTDEGKWIAQWLIATTDR